MMGRQDTLHWQTALRASAAFFIAQGANAQLVCKVLGVRPHFAARLAQECAQPGERRGDPLVRFTHDRGGRVRGGVIALSILRFVRLGSEAPDVEGLRLAYVVAGYFCAALGSGEALRGDEFLAMYLALRGGSLSMACCPGCHTEWLVRRCELAGGPLRCSVCLSSSADEEVAA